MITKEEVEKIIEDNLDSDRLKRIIRNTSVVAWDNVITEQNVNLWLENFTGKYFQNVENEKKLALWLLAHFVYYTYEDIRVLCKVLFNRIMHEKILGAEEVCSIEGIIRELSEETLFIGLGNNSESGNNLLYYFRQENRLPKSCFEYDSEKQYKNLIYIDDITMSGSQAVEYIESRRFEISNVYAGFLIATDVAIGVLNNSQMKIKTVSTMTLDSRDRVFSEESYVFSDKAVKEIKSSAKEFCEIYGKVAIEYDGYMSKWPLGFADGQYILGFEYNTPDNTLPIFWGTSNGWYPLFKRYQKIYSKGKESALDGRKYY